MSQHMGKASCTHWIGTCCSKGTVVKVVVVLVLVVVVVLVVVLLVVTLERDSRKYVIGQSRAIGRQRPTKLRGRVEVRSVSIRHDTNTNLTKH